MAITDRAWVEGKAQLVACCTSADLTPEMAHEYWKRLRNAGYIDCPPRGLKPSPSGEGKG